MSKILLNHDASQPFSDQASISLSALESFIIDTYGTRDPEVSRIFRPATELKLDGSFETNFGFFKSNANTKIVPISDLPAIAPEVNANIARHVISALNPSNEYFVLFDELDIGFGPNDDAYHLRLIGLILAARDLRLEAAEHNRNLRIIIFLRNDIYSALRFEDKNKITEGFLEEIAWDQPGSEHTLKGLMEKRFSTLLGIPEEGAWNVVFNETREMTGHQTKYQHIVDRTMLRPRDVIKFCNSILPLYKADENRKGQFDNEHVNSAREDFSNYLLNELTDEVFKHLGDHDKYFELLRELEALQFTPERFDEACRNRPDLVPSLSGSREILASLFEFSVIGYYQPGGTRGGATFVYRYKSPQARFNPNAQQYQVHLGLQEALGLKRYHRSATQ